MEPIEVFGAVAVAALALSAMDPRKPALPLDLKCT